MRIPRIQTYLTNGMGNNLFQYIYARLIAESHGGVVGVKWGKDAEYSLPEFRRLGIRIEEDLPRSGLPVIRITDKNASTKFYTKEYDGKDFSIKGYFEDYRLYADYIGRIWQWFTPVKKTNRKDFVFHLRLGDRLFYEETYRKGIKLDPSRYVKAIEQFEFDRLHVVTDMRDWEVLTKKKLSKMHFHFGGVGGKDILGTKIGINDPQIAVDYFNSVLYFLDKFNPIVHYGKRIFEDFNFIRSFDKILFRNSTLAWWAAALSHASKVGVYGPWRPSKGSKNKNLAQVTLPGWFQWS